MINETLREAEQAMRKALDSMEEDLSSIRTGRASPSLVEKLLVNYYGMPTQLIQLAMISIPEPRQILIRPFDTKSLKDIEKGILASDLNLTPNNDGKSIRLFLPQPTEERRHDLVKVVNTRLEEGRIQVRNIRRDALKDLREFESEKLIPKDDLKRAEDDLQQLTDVMIEEIDAIGIAKEKEVMEV